MAIVSISEASRLSGKTRATIHRHINTGKLSKVKDNTGNIGIDISELIRVYDIKIDTTDTCINDVKTAHHDTGELNTLKTRLVVLESENNLLKDHVNSLKQAMLILEHKKKEKTNQSKKGWFAKLFS